MMAKKVVWTVLLGLVLCANAQARLLLVLSQESSLYRDFGQGFVAALNPDDPQGVRQLLAADFRPEVVPASGGIIVSAGVEAARQLAEVDLDGVSVIYTMLPLSSYYWLRDNDMLAERHKVVLIDQPVYRFAHLVTAALPGVDSLSYLYGEVSAEHIPLLERAARRHGLKLTAVPLQDGDRRLVTTLQEAVTASDAILVLPDPYLFNRRAIQSLLLASLRGRKPLIAYSESYVRAGALLALFSSPEQLGRQSAELVNCYFKECPADAGVTYHPKYFSVEVNTVIARQLGLVVPPIKEIQGRLEALESGPASR